MDSRVWQGEASGERSARHRSSLRPFSRPTPRRAPKRGLFCRPTPRRAPKGGLFCRPTPRRGQKRGPFCRPTPRRGQKGGLFCRPTPRRGPKGGPFCRPTPRRGPKHAAFCRPTPCRAPKKDCLRYPPLPAGYPSAKHKAAERMGDRSPQSVRRPFLYRLRTEHTGPALELAILHLIVNSVSLRISDTVGCGKMTRCSSAIVIPCVMAIAAPKIISLHGLPSMCTPSTVCFSGS